MSHFNHGSTWVRKLLSDNQVGVILQFNSGLPFTLTSNRDLNVDGNNARSPAEHRPQLVLPAARYNVDARLSRFIPLGGTRRVEILGEFKNIFNIVQTSAIRNGVNVDTAGERPVAAGLRHDAVDADVAAVGQQRLPADSTATSSASSSWDSNSRSKPSRGFHER